MAKVAPARIRITIFSENIAEMLNGLSSKQRSLFIESACLSFVKTNAGAGLQKSLQLRSPKGVEAAESEPEPAAEPESKVEETNQLVPQNKGGAKIPDEVYGDFA